VALVVHSAVTEFDCRVKLGNDDTGKVASPSHGGNYVSRFVW
jgi:hypothetical protein